MKFVIATHIGFWERDGGLNCLIQLAKMLNERGQDVKLRVPPGQEEGYKRNKIYPHYFEGDAVDEDCIVIYIDCTLGNPLKAKKVVRYLTYGSHWYPNYEPNETIYYHAPFCKNNPAKQRLMPIHWPEGLENKGLERTNQACFMTKKGDRYRDVQELFANSQHPYGSDLQYKSHDELIHTFNTTKYFYCFDPCSFLVIMALMCGCVVIQHPFLGLTADEWKYMVGLETLDGIAYGHENLAHAEATMPNAVSGCLKFKQKSESTVDKFIQDMETGNYTTEPCYRFNDSPYSLQHISKA